MKNMTLHNITKACGGTFYGESAQLAQEVAGIALDSRKITKDWLFVATKGERVDGHSFIRQVAKSGALCVISEQNLKTQDWYQESPCNFILVSDSFQALKDLAEFYLSQLSVKVVGITGSVGKTSTKEMIAGVLSEKYNVLKTAGNFNNEVGLPLTVFELKESHEIAVLEMGISDFGEMHRLGKIAKPDICVITNIGQCHLENLGDRDGVLRAKTEVFEEMQTAGDVVLNGDDDKLASITKVHGKAPYFFHKVQCEQWVAEEQGCQRSDHMVYADCIRNQGLLGTVCRIHTGFTFESGELAAKNQFFEAHIKVPGEVQVNNACAAATVGLLLGMTAEQIRAGIEKVTPISGRTNLIQTGNYMLVDDCYNANPMSMRAAVSLLATANTRRVAVLGDMFELGADSDRLHFDTGVCAAESGIEVLCFIGENAKHLYEGAKKAAQGKGQLYYFADKAAFLQQKNQILKTGDTILLKASHGMGFTELVENLKD